jgi:hypothetical protein
MIQGRHRVARGPLSPPLSPTLMYSGQPTGAIPVFQPPSYGGGVTSAPSALGGLAGRLSEQVARLHVLIDRARSVSHDVFGPMPETGAKAPPSSAPVAGHYGNLVGWLDSLDHALGDLGSHLDRLGGI